MSARFARKFISASVLLPVLAVVLTEGYVLTTTFIAYLGFLRQSHGAAILYLSSGSFTATIPTSSLFPFLLRIRAVGMERMLAVLHAPGMLIFPPVYHLISKIDSRAELLMLRGMWYPLCALPAWWFVGRGIDGALKKTRMRRIDLIVSTVLLLISLTISAGLRFGLSTQERAADDHLQSVILGFGLWAILIFSPAAAWFLQRGANRVGTLS